MATSILRSLFFAAASFLILSSSTTAQDANAENAKAQDAQEKADTPKTLMQWITLKVTDLSEEQSAAIKKLESATGAKQKEILKAAGITWKMSRKRAEAFAALPPKTKNAFQKSCDAAGYTEEQALAQKKIGKGYNLYRLAAMKVLKAEQIAMLPEKYQKEFAAAKKLAEEKKK